MPRALEKLNVRLRGSTHPELVLCDDGRQWVVKSPGGRAGPMGVASELIGYRLAALLGVPTPPWSLVEVPWRRKNPCFGSGYLPGCVPGEEYGAYPAVRNKEAFPAIIVLDYWLGNRRGSANNLLLAPDGHTVGEGRGGWLLRVIDCQRYFLKNALNVERLLRHSHRVQGRRLKGQHAAFVRQIARWEEFEAPLKRLEEVPDDWLQWAVEDLPAEWWVARRQKEALLTFIRGRRSQVRRCLEELRRHVPHWAY